MRTHDKGCRYYGSTGNNNVFVLQPLQSTGHKLKRKYFMYRSEYFLNHCYSVLPDLCPTTRFLCPTTCLFAVCCHFTFGVALHRSQTRHQVMVQDSYGLQVVPLPLFPLPYCLSCTFPSFALISLVLPSFHSVLALPLPCSSQGFVQTGLICREK